MKYIKLFEISRPELFNEKSPKLWDFVICHESFTESASDDIYEYIKNNIGRIVEKNFDGRWDFLVHYENLDEDIKSHFIHGDGNCRPFDLNEIEFWSEDYEDLEAILTAKKYNL